MTISTPAFFCLIACLHGAAKRRDHDALVVRLADDVLWGWPEGVRDERDRVLHRDLEVRTATGRRPTEQAFDLLDVIGERGDAVAIEQVVDPLAMRRRDHLVELLFGDVALVFADVLGRDDGVDAVRLAVDVLVDPLQLELELFRGCTPRRPTPRAHRPGSPQPRRRGND